MSSDSETKGLSSRKYYLKKSPYPSDISLLCLRGCTRGSEKTFAFSRKYDILFVRVRKNSKICTEG